MRRLILTAAVAASIGGCASNSPKPAARAAEPSPSLASPLTDIQSRNKRNLERYLAADDPAAAQALLAPSYRPRMLDWDTALHPRRTISLLAVNEDAAVAVIHEDNDFSRQIGHPGWDGTITFLFDGDGAITKTKFTPTPGKNPSWGPYLEPALPWLREHRAQELAAVYVDRHLVQTGDAARTWTKILRDWRAATGRAAVD